MIAATITLPSRSDRAVALARSLARRQPDMQLVVVFIGDATPFVTLPENAQATDCAALGVEYDLELNVALDGNALQQALRAAVAEKLFARDERVLMLDDGMYVSGSLAAFDKALDDAAMAVAAAPLSGDAEADSLWAGVDRGNIHTGVTAFKDCAPTRELIAGWPGFGLAPVERKASMRDGFNAWCDSLPLHDHIATLGAGLVQTDLGLAVAQSAELSSGRLVVDGHDVSLVDLSEFDPHRPHLVSSATRKTMISGLPVVADILMEHASVLTGAVGSRSADPWTTLPDGTPLTPLLRSAAHGAKLEGEFEGDVFTDAGTKQFLDFLAQPASHGRAAGLNLYHEMLWNERVELQQAYPHLDGPDGYDFAGWLHLLRPQQIPMPDSLLPPLPQKHTPRVEPITTRPPFGVNVTGLLSGKLGLGEAARWIINTLSEAGVPNKPLLGRLRVPGEEIDEYKSIDSDAPYAINLVCLNGDTLPKLTRDLGEGFFKHRYNAALWWWELPEFPEDWSESFKLLDEVWVATDFIYNVVAPVSPIPVHKIKLPVVVAPFEPRSRAELGMPDDFVFLFVHDYHSTMARKNPLGLVEAFRSAFPEGSGASLVIKSINGDRMPQSHEAVMAAARGRSDIHLIDGFVDSGMKNAMIDSCDCYVSLHRSEGFGQTIAEAMWLGRPAIATGFGGNLDFMDAENSYLVRHDWARVGDDAHPYPPDGEWAEPDLQHAAELMREVFENPAEAAARGKAGAASIRRTNSAETAGRSMTRRLETIHGWIADDPAFQLNPKRHAARFPRPHDEHAKLSPKRIAKYVLFRLENFSLRRQRAIDSAVTGVERQLEASSSEMQTQIGKVNGEIAELRAQLDALRDERVPEDSGDADYQR